MDMYKLVDKVPVPSTIEEWDGKVFRQSRKVAYTVLPDGRRVSTVFLGLDHRLGGEGPPVLFESMIFGQADMDEQDMDRYCTWEEAVEGHRNMVEKYGGRVMTKDFFDEDLFIL